FSNTKPIVLTGCLFRTAGDTVARSPYAIGQGTLVLMSNYVISFSANELTVTVATLTVKADPQSKVYGAADPALTYKVSGLQFSDTEPSVLTGSLSRTDGETVAGSPYAIRSEERRVGYYCRQVWT